MHATTGHNRDDDVPPAKIITTAQQAYRALSIAASKIGANNYARQIAAHRKAGRSPRTFRFTVTDAHRLVVDSMPAVLAGKITPEQAMAVLHEYDVLQQRTS